MVGGGIAGVSAALSAARLGAETTLVDSKKIGVSRALMTLILSDGLTEEEILLPEAKALHEAGVESRPGETVTSVEPEAGKVRLVSRGREMGLAFDSLVICSGAAASLPQVRGLAKKNVFVLKEPADYLGLAGALDSLDRLVVSGPVPLALKVGEALSGRGRQVRVYCGRGGLERQFSPTVAAAIRRGAGAVALVDSCFDSILGLDEVEAVASEGRVETCDAVVVVPRGVPSFPKVDCQKGQGGGILVDEAMRTSLPGVFAAGDAAELRFGQGSVPARLYSAGRTGGEVAGVNAAGGNATAAPSWAVEQTYFGVESCSAGLGREDAAALGLEVSTATTESRDPNDPTREVVVSMVYDRATHRVYGFEAAGWRASSLSGAASLIVSLGLTVEKLVHLEAPFSPGSNYPSSPIALTAAKIAESPSP